MKFIKQKGNTLGDFLVLIVLLAGVVGYIKNIVALCHAGTIATWAAMEIVRIIGIIIPIIGAVVGYF